MTFFAGIHTLDSFPGAGHHLPGWRPPRDGAHFFPRLFTRGNVQTPEPPMKIWLSFLLAAALAGSATAGDVTLYNDQAFPRLIRLGHRGQKLFAGWMYPGQRVTVRVDETRKGKPILMVDVRESSSSSSAPKWTFRAYPLAKKSEPLFYNLSWFPRGF